MLRISAALGVAVFASQSLAAESVPMRTIPQNDSAARMDWCVAGDFKQANHNPHPVLNGDRSTDVIVISAKGGTTVPLSAVGTDAGDEGQKVTVTWWIYPEAGTIDGARVSSIEENDATVNLPPTAKAGTVHVILQAEDNGSPHLVSYRRVVIEVTP